MKFRSGFDSVFDLVSITYIFVNPTIVRVTKMLICKYLLYFNIQYIYIYIYIYIYK